MGGRTALLPLPQEFAILSDQRCRRRCEPQRDVGVILVLGSVAGQMHSAWLIVVMAVPMVDRRGETGMDESVGRMRNRCLGG